MFKNFFLQKDLYSNFKIYLIFYPYNINYNSKKSFFTKKEQ